MLRLPDHIAGLLQDLEKEPLLLARLTGGEDPRLETIRELGLSGHIGIVAHLAPLICETGKLSTAAIAAIGKLIAGASGGQLLQLDEELRARCPWWKWNEWYNVKPAQVRQLHVSDQNASAEYGVLSFHPNGHVREVAVRRLEKIQDGSELPFLLIRLNDWVRTVHELSRSAVLNRIAANRFPELFEHLELVFWLEGCGRYDHSEIVTEVVTQLASIDSAENLMKAMRSDSRAVRRRAYRSTIGAGVSDSPRIVRCGLSSDDGVLRLWATRDAKTLLSDSELEQILPALLADRFLPVRREALRCAIERFPAKAKESLAAALLDPSYSMRELARFYLRRGANFDIAAYYREQLSQLDLLLPAIAGLGESGGADDEWLVRPFLAEGRPKVRAAAIRSVGRLNKGVSVATLLDAMRGPSKRVTAEARIAIERAIDSVTLPDLLGLLHNEERTHVLLAVVELIDLKETWMAMPHLIEASTWRNSDVASAAKAKIRSKFNRLFTNPTNLQRDAINCALRQNADSLDVEFVTEFGKWLASRT